MQNILETDLLCADITYKLTWEKSPLQVIGNVDQNNKFHVIAMSVCYYKRQADYSFVFRVLKNELHKLISGHKITTLHFDAAPAISNTFKEVFRVDTICLMCWAHVKTNIKKNKKHVPVNHRDEFFQDLDQLQLSATPEIFNHAKRLFTTTWRRKAPDMMVYLQQQWFTKNN